MNSTSDICRAWLCWCQAWLLLFDTLPWWHATGRYRTEQLCLDGKFALKVSLPEKPLVREFLQRYPEVRIQQAPIDCGAQEVSGALPTLPYNHVHHPAGPLSHPAPARCQLTNSCNCLGYLRATSISRPARSP